MKRTFSLTAHCLVRNEENFIWYAIKSVIDYVDRVIVFDTGSSDKTVQIIQQLVAEHPHDKIFFEEKGLCDKKRHTELRQEMIERTTTDWFMILDGDEVWTEQGMVEVYKAIEEGNADCIIAPFYLCVGDVYHYSKRGYYEVLGKRGHFYPRFFRRIQSMYWKGDYGEGDYVFAPNGKLFYETKKTIFLQSKYWHASALIRSSEDDEIKLGRHKAVMSYSLRWIGMGFRIDDVFPSVFQQRKSQAVQPISRVVSLKNMIVYLLTKYVKNFVLNA